MAKNEDNKTADNVADEGQNKGLKHSKGGVTTRDDRTDLGVPMLPGSPDEPQGPEDALGLGPKRGDYTLRIGPSNYEPHEVLPVDDGGDADTPNVKVESQRGRADEIGDEPKVKGGVTTQAQQDQLA